VHLDLRERVAERTGLPGQSVDGVILPASWPRIAAGQASRHGVADHTVFTVSPAFRS
jgi:hypothetical protein